MLNAHPTTPVQSRLEEKRAALFGSRKDELIFEIGGCAIEFSVQEKTKMYTSFTYIGQVLPQNRLRIHCVCREHTAIRRPQSEDKIANSDLQVQFVFQVYILP